MQVQKQLLLLPVENQVRELDAKLLLACVATQHGFCSVIGPRRKIEFRISSFPRSIFVSKDLARGNGRLFKILNKLGHICVAWDEEGLIHQPPEVYYKERFAPNALKYVSQLFAWGPNNAALWRKFPGLPEGKPIHITGTPRGDMLRVEMRPFFEKDVELILQAYGKFILINTNFGEVNAIIPIQNLIQPTKGKGAKLKLGRAAKGMTLDYARKYEQHVQSIFDDFKQLIKNIDKIFPDITFVVRPHPSENNQIYHQIASHCRNVRVTNEGNVLPWLIAAKALIHNGCTTAVEAYAMGVPSIAYRATVDDYFDRIFNLPNSLSHQCFTLDELKQTLEQILDGRLGVPNGNEPRSLFNRYFKAQEGRFACEHIVDLLKKIAESEAEWPQPGLSDRLEGRYRATRRRLQKQIKSYLPNATIPLKLERGRYPGISIKAMQERILRFQDVLKLSGEIKTIQISDQLFQISI